MNIKSMLVRLQGALGNGACTNQMLLIAGNPSTPLSEEINLVVGYNGSANSQAALDLTLWMAHQTRLATRQRVVVQAVYVIESAADPVARDRTPRRPPLLRNSARATTVVAPTQALQRVDCPAQLYRTVANEAQIQAFETAERILWQARSFAEEWRGSLNTHLRFGHLATELRQVAEAEAATVLLLGCHTAEHPLVKQIGNTFPCPVIGLPSHV